MADAVDSDDFGVTFHLSRMDRKTLPVHSESALFVTRRRFSLSIHPRVADALASGTISLENRNNIATCSSPDLVNGDVANNDTRATSNAPLNVADFQSCLLFISQL